MPNASRDQWRGVLTPYQWMTLCQFEDPYADPAYFYHHLHAFLAAEVTNRANVRAEVHESENGVNWMRSSGHRPVTILVPGGESYLAAYHNLRHVRVVLYSVGGGIVHGTKFPPELQVLPGSVLSPVDVEVCGNPTVTVALADPDPPKPCVLAYDFEARLDWDSVEWCWETNTAIEHKGSLKLIGGGWPSNGEWCWWLYPGLDLYVRDIGASEVVYYGSDAGVDLNLNHNAFPNCLPNPEPPEIIAGSFTAANSFYVWYSQGSACAPETEPRVKRITITNTGTCALLVNGVTVNAGEVYTLNDFLYAGYATGDMSAWLGGTPVAV